MMKLRLSHASNPDIVGGYWQQPVDTRRAKVVTVRDFDEASRACREYIERNCLGSGNWTGGELKDGSGAFVGRVYYNGRVYADRDCHRLIY